MKKRVISAVTACIIGILALSSCRQEESAKRPSVEKLAFRESKKVIAVGQQVSVALEISPAEARKYADIEYGVSAPGVIEIDKARSGADGVVFTGKKTGSAVIFARTGGVVDYCDVTVRGESENEIPYISLTDAVLEIPVGGRKHLLAQLQGGNPADQGNFTFTNSADYFVYMESANNTVVLEGLKKGVSRVTAAHPKAQYTASAIVFVLNEGETARYITGENVVFMELNGSSREYSARMVGVDEICYNSTIYIVTEGTNVVDVKSGGASCTIIPKSAGVAKVRVTNAFIPDYVFEFQVVVQHTADLRYIKTTKSFYIINGNENVTLTAAIEGKVPEDWYEKFHFTIAEEHAGIISALQAENQFLVQGLANGTALLTITNDYCDFASDVLFLVQNRQTEILQEGMYIRTSQQVIQMEAGKNAPEAILIMELVGGTGADQNMFEWVVEDSSIISVTSPDGTVSYKRAQANLTQSYEARAIITGKKPGTTRITVYNKSPKCLNEANVIVKVYPYGTFNGTTVYLSGPSIVKLPAGAETEVYTPVVGGRPENLGITLWESSNTSIAEVFGAGNHGAIRAKPGVTGVAKLTVQSESTPQPFECVIVVYEEGKENTVPYIYTDNINYRIAAGQTIIIPVYHPNIPLAQLNMSVRNTNASSVFHTVVNDVITVSGYDNGGGELVITSDFPGCNTLSVYITVENEKIDEMRPYEITATSNYLGVRKGQTAQFNVNMTGAGPNEIKNILWNMEDASIASLEVTNGNEVMVRGLSEGQTVLKINHSKSINEKMIIVYVAPPTADPQNIVVIGIDRQNHVIMKNQSVFLKLITNANDEDKALFAIKGIENQQNIHVDWNYDSMLITGITEGQSKITVWCYDPKNTNSDPEKRKKNLMDLDIFITVKEKTELQGEIGFPDSVVLVKGKYKKVIGNAIGVSSGGLSVSYIPEDPSVVSVSGDGIEAVFKGLKKGETYAQVACSQLGFYKKVLVICVEDEAELEKLYYFTVPKNLYRVKIGDEINVKLQFGENGRPKDAVFEWNNTGSNDAVKINKTTDGAVITGTNEGRAVIQVSCANMPEIKAAEIIIEVSNTVYGSDLYRFGIDSYIHPMSLKDEYFSMIPISIYCGMEYYDYDEENVLRFNPGIKMDAGYNGIKAGVSDETVITAAMGNGVNSQFLIVSAFKEGRSEITLTHEMINEPAKILVIVYAGEIPPASERFVFYIPQRHHLIQKNETRKIDVLVSGEANPLPLTWINNNPELFALDTANRKQPSVTGLKTGSGTVLVSDEKGQYETVYVSVGGEDGTSIVSAATESIIVLSLDGINRGGYLTQVVVNGGSAYGITWKTDDTDIIDILPTGPQCVIYPLTRGDAQLTVTGNGFTKTLIVKVVGTEQEKQNISIVNSDQRHFRIREGESVIVNPFYKTIKPVAQAVVTPVFNNKVVEWEYAGKGLSFTGKNTGIQYVNISNPECKNKVLLIFEVDNTNNGNITDTTKYVYMTTEKTVIILEPGFADYYTEIKMLGEYEGSEKDFIWRVDNPKITLNAFGTYAFISAAKGEYRAAVTVENKYCAYPLEISIVVGQKYTQEAVTTPYMYTERNVYTMNKSDSSLLIPLEIRNVANVNYNEVQTKSSSNALTSSFANGNIIINAKDTGNGIVEVTYKGLNLKIMVIVQEVLPNGAVYLTTSQNYVIVNTNGTKPVSVSLINRDDPESAKITWKTENTGVANVIGSGKSVQVLGTAPGITRITASHQKSFNDLSIIVKVLPSDAREEVCYLTTGENVIEIYASANSRQITVAKVGGNYSQIEAVWSTDNPLIASVMGQNDTAFITAKKEGIAKLTVSDREAGTLEIVVVVRAKTAGDLIIRPSEPIVQIRPGSVNGVLSVSMDGIEESEEAGFKWNIYSQLPSSIETAREGGSVLDIYAMGKRCTINGLNAGTARIRVTHPRASEPAYIIVQVTHFSELKFGQKTIEIVRNDLAYVSIQTPDYENYTEKVKFRVDNQAVVSAIGTYKVALLSAATNIGKAVVTAYIEGTELQDSIEVEVVDEKKYNEPEILVNQNMFILSPREAPFYVNASLIGFGVTEYDQNSLHWEFNFTSPEEEKEKPMLKMYPQNVEGNKGFESVGQSILFEVQQYRGKVFTSIEYITLTISHPLTTRKRVIYFQIQEDSNSFSISRKQITLETGQTEELSCTILNGGPRDYDEVVWEARRDSVDPGKDIVRVIGKGQKVQLLGMSDGMTIVTATYRGVNAGGTTCQVLVQSYYYFNISFQEILAYPGQKDNDGYGMFSIGYSVRPPNAPIEWVNTASGYNGSLAEITVSKTEEDATGTGQGRIYFNFLREGDFLLLGTSNHKISKVHVTVHNTWGIVIQGIYQDLFKVPYTEKGEEMNNDGIVGVRENTKIRESGYAIPYIVTPSNASIRLVPNPGGEYSYDDPQKLLTRGWDVIIGTPRREGLSAHGFIYVKNHVEDKVNLRFRLFKADNTPVDPGTEYDRVITFTSRFDNGYARLIPVFQRTAGYDSNPQANMQNLSGKKYPSASPDRNTANANAATRYGTTSIVGEYLLPSSGSLQNAYAAGDRITDSYKLTIADGEEHYIILDKAHPLAKTDIITKSTIEDPIGNSRGISTEFVTLENGMNAIKISGGKDFVLYNQFETKHDLVYEIETPFAPYYDTVKTKTTNAVPQRVAWDYWSNIARGSHFYTGSGLTWDEGTRYYASVPHLKSDGTFYYKEIYMREDGEAWRPTLGMGIIPYKADDYDRYFKFQIALKNEKLLIMDSSGRPDFITVSQNCVIDNTDVYWHNIDYSQSFQAAKSTSLKPPCYDQHLDLTSSDRYTYTLTNIANGTSNVEETSVYYNQDGNGEWYYCGSGKIVQLLNGTLIYGTRYILSKTPFTYYNSTSITASMYTGNDNLVFPYGKNIIFNNIKDSVYAYKPDGNTQKLMTRGNSAWDYHSNYPSLIKTEYLYPPTVTETISVYDLDTKKYYTETYEHNIFSEELAFFVRMEMYNKYYDYVEPNRYVYYNNEYIYFPNAAVLNKQNLPVFTIVGMEIFDVRYLDEKLVTEWRPLTNTFTRPAGKENGYPLIVIKEDSINNSNHGYFSVSIQSPAANNNPWPSYQELERISYNPYDILFTVNDKVDFLTGKTMFNNMFPRMTKNFYFRYLYDEGQNKPVKKIENFLYNKKQEISVSQYSTTDEFILSNTKRNELQYGLNHQKDEYAYNSNNLNLFFDNDTNGYKNNFNSKNDSLTNEEITANRNALGYVHYDKNSYLMSDIQSVFIRPKETIQQNSFTRYSNKKLTEFPLGGKYRSNTNQVFTLLDLRQKGTNGKEIFRPYPEQSDTVVYEKTFPLIIQYKNLHTDDTRPCTLTINITYQIRPRRVRLSDASSQPYYTQIEKSFDDVKKEPYNNQSACNIPFSAGISSCISDYEKLGGYITIDKTY